MRKFYISNKNELNEEELRTGKVSYGRIVDRYIDNLILCNNIPNVDDTIWNSIENLDEYDEIYQYFLCNIDEYIKDQLIEWGFIFSYSEALELDVLMVDHWGTSWNYVMTDVEWSENYEECK